MTKYKAIKVGLTISFVFGAAEEAHVSRLPKDASGVRLAFKDHSLVSNLRM